MKMLRHNLKHKYSAKPTEVDGIRFDSKKEAKYYSELKLRVMSGEVVMFLRQVPLHLIGSAKMVIDFLEFHADGSIHWVDVKGFETDTFKKNRKMVEAKYPIEIETV